jgi:phosphatidyl-myo-inositol dimannoside synthase
VLPTRVEAYDFEGFGLVFLEAAAAGKPSIGGRNGGVPEAVLEGETGLLVSGHDVEELAAAIGRLISSPELRQQMGQAGRARAVRDFTWERAAAQVSSIHQEVAERGRRRSSH